MDAVLWPPTRCLLVDRKGYLCRYACPEWWQEIPSDPQLAARKQQLHDQIEVCLYTPGHPGGNPLSISVVPGLLNELPSHARQQVCGFAAASLAAMMKYKAGATSDTKRVFLTQAI